MTSTSRKIGELITEAPLPEATRVSADGLRYISKSQGTDFPGAFAASMSCFLCGRHVPRSSLQGFKVAGVLQLRCKVSCT